MSIHRWPSRLVTVPILTTALLLLLSARASCQNPELDEVAVRFTKKMLKKHRRRVIVADFTGPGDTTTELGRKLADQFSETIAHTGASIDVIPRANIVITKNRSAIPNPPEGASVKHDRKVQANFMDGYLAWALAEAAGAETIVTGSLQPSEGKLILLLHLWDIPVHSQANAVSGPAPGAYFEKLEQRTVELAVSASREELLAKLLPPPPPDSAQITAGFGTTASGKSNARTPPDTKGGDETIYEAGKNGVGNPACVDCPSPLFPADALPQARVILRCIITPEGRVTNIRVVKSGGEDFDKKAIEAVSKWRLKPARDPSGRPVAVRTVIEVSFRRL